MNLSTKTTPRKHFKFGIELEMFTLDKKGYMTNGADRLIKRVLETNPEISIIKECGKNMIEIGSRPNVEVPDAMEKVISNLEIVLYCAEKEGLVLYPFGTYPGVFTPKFNKEKPYKIKEEIFGKRRWTISGRCVGFHCHYTLPWGVFDSVKKIIKQLVNSQNQVSLVNIYNFFIAIDPALTAFTQSSPFYQGRHLGKDSRMLMYRGGTVLDSPQGLYSNYQNFGALQQYRYTSTDLLHAIISRFDKWVELIDTLEMNVKSISKHGSRLDTAWNPVKVNAHGTMEQRGMDMNLPSVLVAVGVIIKYCSKLIHEEFIQVLPSEIAIEQPFKKVGNRVYIPPHTHVRFDLQKKSAYQGLANQDIHRYCSGLLKLAKQAIPKNRHIMLEPLENMLRTRKTMSDEIIEIAQSLGVKNINKINNKQSAALALQLSQKLFQDIVITKKMLQNLQ